MLENKELDKYLADLLSVSSFKDYCPNGLQVQGRRDLKKIVFGVTASQALIEKSIELDADAIIVHHGYFWKGENSCITGIKKDRLKLLLANEVNLYAYHLPLDCHAQLGNNVQLANLLGIKISGGLSPLPNGQNLGNIGVLEKAISVEEFCEHLNNKLNRQPLVVGKKEKNIKTLAWCTGAAQDFIQLSKDLGADAYISGEISERTVHEANELGVTYFCAGHHATERGGVLALCEHLRHKFSIDCTFVDLDNPV